MKIKLHEIPIKDVVEGYIDKHEDGVVGYEGRLDIRPPFQREFIYNEKERNAVIETINKEFPLNVMYWCSSDENLDIEDAENLKKGHFELLDGQQRTISICQYVAGDFSINQKYFNNLSQEAKDTILNYHLMVYVCNGSTDEKLDWFNVINIAGKDLSPQELRNAMYSKGKWLYDAKRHFSKIGCPAYQIGEKYMTATLNRQEYLETVIRWITDNGNDSKIREYMGKHEYDNDADELWQYYQDVINWIQKLFPHYRKEMKGVDWGILYNEYKDNQYNTNFLEEQTKELMMDDDVTNKKGIYYYLITGKEKYLNIRSFTDNQKREAYEKQKGICPNCKEHFEIEEMEADHITPWHDGGKTTSDNCQMLCRECNRRKSGI